MDYCAVMLSEPPVARPAPVHTAYKGVLLCERPSNKPAPVQQPFFVGKSDPLSNNTGLAPSAETRQHMEGKKAGVTRKHKETALTKHNKWLKEQQRKNEQAVMTHMEQELDKEMAQKEFQAEQQRMRQILLKQRDEASMKVAGWGETSSTSSGNTSARRGPTPPRHPTPPRGLPASAALFDVPRTANSHTKKKKKSKPKWAMTEEEAEDAELAEGLKLANFAEELNFDDYLENNEIRNALELIQKKVDETSDSEDESDEERNKVIKEIDEMSDVQSTASGFPPLGGKQRKRHLSVDQPPATPALSTCSHDTEWLLNTKHRNIINAEAMKLAETILAKNEQMRQVHTKISLAKVLQELTKRSMKTKKGEEVNVLKV